VEQLAPKQLAEDWDNVGLQIGNPAAEVKKVLLTLDLDEHVLTEAKEKQVQLIITHHPVLFKGIKNINFTTVQGRLIKELIKNDITVYSAHTNLDSATGGVNDVLAEKLELQNTEVLVVNGRQKFCKLVVFVPVNYQAVVGQALGQAGAGWIGNYSDCTFRTNGIGTFRPLSGSNPFIGKTNELETVQEVRLETNVPAEKLSAVIETMLGVHPYEEVDYDIYPLNNTGAAHGLGRIGQLPMELNFSDFLQQVRNALNLPMVKAGGQLDKRIKTVALCGGSAGDFWPTALAKGADVYLSGDIKYHTAQDMVNNGLAFVDAGHYHSEVPVVERLYHHLKKIMRQENLAVELYVAQTSTDPFIYW